MCGRFVSSSSPERIAAHFGAVVTAESVTGESLGENYNVTPTTDIYGILERHPAESNPAESNPAESGRVREVQVFHWGLVPVWAKDPKIGQRMINARSETLAEKPAFTSAFRKHRCIIPMDGFYEWKPGNPDGPLTKSGKPVKQPVFVRRIDGEPLAVAGLWAAWRDRGAAPGEPWLHSATVITTEANATMSPIHDRMPVVLPAGAWDEWLDPSNHDLAALSALLLPAPDDLLVTVEVSTDVNNARTRGGPELLTPR